MPEWPVKPLEDLCELTVGHVGSMASQYVSHGVPFLRSQNVRRGRLDLTELKYIPLEFHQIIKKSRLFPNDVVMVRTGEPGAAALITNDLGEANCSDLVIARPGGDIDPRYLCYSINATAGHYIAAHLVGAVQQHFNVGSARKLQITVPPLPMQVAISEALEALDNKIAVNDATAAIAESLLGAHFSDAMQQSMREFRLGQLISLRYGKALKEEDRTPGRIPVFGGNGVSGRHDTPLEHGPGIIVGRKGANAGSVSWSQGAFWAIDTSFYVEPVSGRVPLEFLFFLLQKTGLRGLVGDSAIPGLNRDIALSAAVVLPADEMISRFSEIARPLLALSAQLADESLALAELRDTLLPKLMSGQIRVRDAEKVVEDVT